MKETIQKAILWFLSGLPFLVGFLYGVKVIESLKEPKIVEKVIEKVKTVQVNDTYYNGVKVNGDCALVEPPCWEMDFERNLDRRSLLRLK